MNIKELRKQLGKTQQELARDMECSIQQIQKVEQNPVTITNCSYRFCHALWYCLIVTNDNVERMELSDFIAEIFIPAMTEKYCK